MKSHFAVLVFVLLVSSLAYAAEQKASGKTQSVVVDFVVGPDGRPTHIMIVEAADKKLADAVVAAVTKWQLDKKYAGKRVRQPVEFQLDDDAPKQKKANHSSELPPGAVH
jgi:TonB family protein